MSFCKIDNALLTDLYELTMMQGYYLINPHQRAVFEMFFRRQPFGGGFCIFAGLDPLIDAITELKFKQEDIDYLKSLGIFKEEFLSYLKDFRFKGDVYAIDEGTIVFPNEPLIRVEGTLLEAQLIESLLLNIINFQTLIATKTARIMIAANGGSVIEFGFRRAHGIDGALSGTRAAYTGGAVATSNVLASKIYNIPVRGTMAHSWVMSFGDELIAFEKYANLYKDNCIFLVDTYDTLKSGIPNAIKVMKKLKKGGSVGYGIRLDSGDLEYLSKEARKMLDRNDLKEATIIASNELDEWIINQIMKNGAPINGWGVGSKLITADKDPWLTGVYKLVAITDGNKMEPVIKVSNNPEKITNPGAKNILRFYDRNGMMLGDLIYLKEEEEELLNVVNEKQAIRFNHPSIEHSFFLCSKYAKYKVLLKTVINNGLRTKKAISLNKIRDFTLNNIKTLDPTYKRLINPHVYKVSISDRLKLLKVNLLKNYL